jgi:putative acetyltransferase
VKVERAAFGSANEAGIVVAIRDEQGSFAFVAEDDRSIVGHVQLSRAWAGTTPIVALGPVGVIPERQGEGIGRALVEAAIAGSASRNEIAIVLLGDPRLYGRFGFEPGSRYGLKNPFSGQTDEGFVVGEEHLMLLPLDERAEALAGEVRWHPAFD